MRMAVLVLALLAAFVRAEEPVELYPCPVLLRLGTMERGVVERPATPGEIAAGFKRSCEYAVLGRFVNVSDSHYDELLGPADEPVAATFEVVEALLGEPVATAKICLRRAMLVVPGEERSRYLSALEFMADELYRRELALQVERELAAIRDSGKPLTRSQHDRLLDAVGRLVEVPPRSNHQLHELVEESLATGSPLSFESELGAIRADQMYLLGLSGENTTGSPQGRCFGSVHTYLFWGSEALDIAAALRERQE